MADQHTFLVTFTPAVGALVLATELRASDSNLGSVETESFTRSVKTNKGS